MKAHRQKERAALELPELVLVLPQFIFALVHYPLQLLSTIEVSKCNIS